ncbi:MAG: PKD domain-containing protein, partial [Sphingobacteriales bacterium]
MKKLLLTLIGLLGIFAAQAQCNTSFTYTTNMLTVTATNNSQVTLVPGSFPTTYYTWGDNSYTISNFTPGSMTSHTYTAGGNYLVTLHTQYFDTLNSVLICDDTVSQWVTVAPSPCASTITTVNNGSGSYTFTANNIGGGTGMTYTWNFGDGSASVSGSPVSHTYTNSGTYTVSLVTTGMGVTCTTSTSVFYFNGTLNCANLNANIGSSVSGLTVNFSNTSTNVNMPGMYIYKDGSWSFGDGNTSTANNPTHTYATPGTYSVTMINEWKDSSNNAVYCTDTAYATVTVTMPPPPPNLISGSVFWDSLGTNVFATTVKVWLITFDSLTNTIDAVDSVIASGNHWGIPYSFSNHPSGEYRTKAAVLNGAPGANNLMPTYHYSSTYWGTANLIYHTGGSNLNRNIYMQSGTPGSGPGFIAGNVTMGAGKGTGAGAPGVLIFLRNSNDDVVRFTYTDMNGDYSFGNIPAGTYNVYPENMPQITTPSSDINLVSGSYTVGGVDFVKNSTEIKPVTTGIEDMAGAAFSMAP